MPVKELNAHDALIAFRDKFKTQGEAAEALEITPAYLSDLLNHRRDISDNILARLGLRRIVVKEQKSA